MIELISASYLLPMTSEAPVIPDGAIVCEHGRILAVGRREELSQRYANARLLHAEGGALMPGLVNAHCHLDMIDFYERQFVENEFAKPEYDFIESLITSIDYKLEIKPEQVITGIQKGLSRLIETGVTCVGDVTHFEGAFNLMEEMGLRGIVYPEIVAGRGEVAQAKFEVALAMAEKHTDCTHEKIRTGLAPYAPYLLSRSLLKIIAQHARDTGIPIQIHAAESFAEMEFFFDSQGPIAVDLFPTMGWRELPPAQHKTPIQFLADIGFLDAPVTVVGGLHLSDGDLPVLSRNLVRIVYCPTMNWLMKHGQLPLGKLMDAGIPIGLGTDIWHTRLGFSLWDEMRRALTRGSTPLPTSKELLKMATIGGARAIGLDHLIGSLETGKQSDYILVRLQNGVKEMQEEEFCGALIAGTQPQHIQRVVVGDSILKNM